MAGNEIQIGKHRFCATPYGNAFNSEVIFSEVTSVAKLTAIQLGFFDSIHLDSKSRYLRFFFKRGAQASGSVK